MHSSDKNRVLYSTNSTKKEKEQVSENASSEAPQPSVETEITLRPVPDSKEQDTITTLTYYDAQKRPTHRITTEELYNRLKGLHEVRITDEDWDPSKKQFINPKIREFVSVTTREGVTEVKEGGAGAIEKDKERMLREKEAERYNKQQAEELKHQNEDLTVKVHRNSKKQKSDTKKSKKVGSTRKTKSSSDESVEPTQSDEEISKQKLYEGTRSEPPHEVNNREALSTQPLEEVKEPVSEKSSLTEQSLVSQEEQLNREQEQETQREPEEEKQNIEEERLRAIYDGLSLTSNNLQPPLKEKRSDEERSDEEQQVAAQRLREEEEARLKQEQEQIEKELKPEAETSPTENETPETPPVTQINVTIPEIMESEEPSVDSTEQQRNIEEDKQEPQENTQSKLAAEKMYIEEKAKQQQKRYREYLKQQNNAIDQELEQPSIVEIERRNNQTASRDVDYYLPASEQAKATPISLQILISLVHLRNELVEFRYKGVSQSSDDPNPEDEISSSIGILNELITEVRNAIRNVSMLDVKSEQRAEQEKRQILAVRNAVEPFALIFSRPSFDDKKLFRLVPGLKPKASSLPNLIERMNKVGEYILKLLRPKKIDPVVEKQESIVSTQSVVSAINQIKIESVDAKNELIKQQRDVFLEYVVKRKERAGIPNTSKNLEDNAYTSDQILKQLEKSYYNFLSRFFGGINARDKVSAAWKVAVFLDRQLTQQQTLTHEKNPITFTPGELEALHEGKLRSKMDDLVGKGLAPEQYVRYAEIQQKKQEAMKNFYDPTLRK